MIAELKIRQSYHFLIKRFKETLLESMCTSCRSNCRLPALRNHRIKKFCKLIVIDWRRKEPLMGSFRAIFLSVRRKQPLFQQAGVRGASSMKNTDFPWKNSIRRRSSVLNAGPYFQSAAFRREGMKGLARQGRRDAARSPTARYPARPAKTLPGTEKAGSKTPRFKG